MLHTEDSRHSFSHREELRVGRILSLGDVEAIDRGVEDTIIPMRYEPTAHVKVTVALPCQLDTALLHEHMSHLFFGVSPFIFRNPRSLANLVQVRKYR